MSEKKYKTKCIKKKAFRFFNISIIFVYLKVMTADTSIEFIKNIGPERAKLLREVLGIGTVGDFLSHYPYKYIDKSKVYTIAELREDLPELQLKGVIYDLKEVGQGRKKRLTAKFRDASGVMDLVWFQYSKWLLEQLPLHKEVIVFGKANRFGQQYSMAHPEIELIERKKDNSFSYLPVYSSSEKLQKRGIHQRFFIQVMQILVEQLPAFMEENLPDYVLKFYQLVSKQYAMHHIHFPTSKEAIDAANRRLKFEEAFYFQLTYALKKQNHLRTAVGHPFPIVGDYFNDFYNNHLPFQLTSAQKRVLKEIRNDMKRPIQMNRLLQGDVGSGKTMVALLSMLLALDNGFQSCLMAPTEILAQQHFNGISELLGNTNIEIRLLTGNTPKKERKIIHQDLLSGKLSILIGTHALLEEGVQFKNLGLAIIDEQHRFGVAQRSKLWKKNQIPPHILIMTATPIPRTLAMSFYSDLEISIIDELPVGRKPIITAHRKEKDRANVLLFCAQEIKKGRQIYFVYPLIEESEVLDYKNLTEAFELIADYYGREKVTMLHGKMSAAEKDQAMQKFANGQYPIMVATTVIEVGVNVPNASVMVIESAERFGLSQLHQLRGRVGRGAEQSYCILMTKDALSHDGRKRIKTMVETHDGFKISEVDMELRGPGDILGTQQSGVVDFKKLDLVEDAAIIKAAKDAVENILEKDPFLEHPDNSVIKKYYQNHHQKKNAWARIS